MGLLGKLLGLATRCPECGDEEAKDSFGGIRCPNRDCRHYDQMLAYKRGRMGQSRGGGAKKAEKASTAYTPAASAPNDFVQTVELGYTNHRGEHRVFLVDAGRAHNRGLFVSVPVAPSGQRISLRKSSIQDSDNKDTLLVLAREGYEDGGPREMLDPVELGYTNHRGEEKLFTVDAAQTCDRGAFISAPVAPTGQRIALRKASIHASAAKDKLLKQARR